MKQATTYSDPEILAMLQDDDRRKEALAYLYRSARVHVIRMVVKYGGQEDDALEILSEGLMVFLENIRKGKFRHGSQLKVYLIGICKFLWRDHRRKSGRIIEISVEDHLETRVGEAVGDHLEREETVRMVQQCLSRLKEACRELLRWRFFEGEAAPWEVIAERLGYGSAQVARNKGQRCMKSLKEIYFELIANADKKKP